MASLESLANPVSRLAVLPDAMNVNKDPTTNSPYWGVDSQYYANDVVLSPTNGGAYLMVGGAEGPGGHLLSVRGAVDPALDVDGVWVRLSQSSWEGAPATPLAFAVGATASAVVAVTAGAAYPAVGGYTYNVQFQGSVAGAGAMAAADWTTWTFTPTGGGTAVSVDVLPKVGANSVNFALSVNVTLADAATAVTLSGAKANPSSQDLTVVGNWSFTQIG